MRNETNSAHCVKVSVLSLLFAERKSERELRKSSVLGLVTTCHAWRLCPQCGHNISSYRTALVGGRYAVQGHSTSLTFSTNTKVICGFLLVNNTNLHSHRSPIIAHYWSKYRLWRGVPLVNALVLGIFCKSRINYILLNTRLHYCGRQCGSIFNHLYTIGTKSTEFGRITHSKRPYSRPRSFKVTNFGAIRKLVSHYLLQWIPTYIVSCTVSKLLRIIGQIFAFDRGYLSLTHPFGWAL